jgi:hypothetical protein
VGPLEVVALPDLLARLVDRVVNLLQVNLGYNVKTWHVLSPVLVLLSSLLAIHLNMKWSQAIEPDTFPPGIMALCC